MGSISRKTVAWGSGAVVAVAGCAAVIVLTTQSSGQAAAAAPASSGQPAAAATPPPPRVVSVSPAAGTRHVDGAGTITVTYSGTLPASAPLPALSPATAGAWARDGDTAVFTPATGFPQDTKVKVTAPQPAGGSPVSASFTTGGYHVLRLQQILAQLGYLPLTWTPAAGAGAGTAAQLAAAYTPPPGTFRWMRGYPAQLHAFWSPGKSNTLDRGAITAFEADHGLTTDGSVSPAVWRALLTAAAKDQRDTHGYSYAIASKSAPESLTIWRGGKQVLSTAANTGIPAAPTADGTFPVYEKLPFQVMTGANPDGSRYSDPVYWISYFNGGDAVHYFDRPSYGYPQSLGCVELPYGDAEQAYNDLPYGTLVTVTG